MRGTELANKQIYEQVEILNTHLQNEAVDYEFLESHAAHLLDLIRLVRETHAHLGGQGLPTDHVKHSETCA